MGRILAVIVTALVVLGGCGGSGSGSGGDAGKVKASFAQWVQDLQRRNAVGACEVMTPAFWSAFAGDINNRLANTGRSVSTGNCQAGLRSLLVLAGHAPIIHRGVQATDVVVHGKTATAHEAGAGPSTV